jgi:DMSO reductase family type II enzyme molybdopterin subunit
MQSPSAYALDRREFLKRSGGAALSLSLLQLAPGCRDAEQTPARPPESTEPAVRVAPPTYGDWRDVWYARWRWDRVVHSSHSGSNCLGACSWNVFVRDGIAWREEQNAIYTASEPGVPDFNPRGCQKGACYTDLMYEPSRVLHPLRRVGERGEGRWKRVSWDEALGEIAEKILDVSVEHGTRSVVYTAGSGDAGAHSLGTGAFFGLLNATSIDPMAGVGDMPMGAVQTLGMYDIEGTSDDWFKSDFIIVWAGNPDSTRIPDAHYLHEARYRGAKLVVIAPDYSASAVHADYWINPRNGTDPALGLAMAQVILSESLHDADYVREQTDLSILAREDTGRYLRASDVHAGGSDEALYFWDEATGALAEVPGCQGTGGDSIALGALHPALSGRYSVQLADGTEVRVRPLLDTLRERLDLDYTPEQVAEVTGLAASTIRRLARELAQAPSAMILASWGACKHYHSDLMQRAAILLMALTGNQGRSGGGFRTASWWPVDGMMAFQRIPLSTKLRLLWRYLTKGKPSWREYEEMLVELTADGGTTPLMPFLYAHAGYSRVWDRRDLHDPAVPRSTGDYMDEAVQAGWIPLSPVGSTPPKVFMFRNANPLRRWPMPRVALENLWPKLDLIVDVNIKLSYSGLHSDIILPAAGYYERDTLKYPQSYLPWLVLCEKAVEPLGESLGEWEIFGRLAREVQQRAQARGLKTVPDSVGGEVDLSTLHDEWTFSGKFNENDSKAPLELLLESTTITGKLDFDEASRTGLLPVIEAKGDPHIVFAAGTDYARGKTLYPHARFAEGKKTWPTFSGRMQFLIDHPWYAEVGEMLPVHKEVPAAGGDHPLRLSGGHTRWSIHSHWRDSALLLRLQRGEPSVWVSSPDAAERSVGDGDRVRVFNDLGAFEAVAKVAPAARPGEVIIYHAWEPHQFKGWRGQQDPVPAPWKALHLAGGYGQIHYRPLYGAPGHHPRAQTVDFAKV